MKSYNLKLILPNIEKQLRIRLYKKVADQIGNQIRNQIKARVWEYIMGNVWNHIKESNKDIGTALEIFVYLNNENNWRKP